MVHYWTTSLDTCHSTASLVLHRPLVLSSRWLVVACCDASVACIFAARPSFWLIVVFIPLSCLLLLLSPKRAFVTVRPVANASCPPPHSSCWPSCLLPNMLPLLLASLSLLCPRKCPHHTGIIAVIALASLTSLLPTLPLSIAAVKQIFAAHPSFG
jgi:hypothetical protein